MSDPEPLSHEYFVQRGIAFVHDLRNLADDDILSGHFREVAAAALRWAAGRCDFAGGDSGKMLCEEVRARADEIEVRR